MPPTFDTEPCLKTRYTNLCNLLAVTPVGHKCKCGISRLQVRYWGHAVAQLVEALPYKFAGSIPDGVIVIFH